MARSLGLVDLRRVLAADEVTQGVGAVRSTSVLLPPRLALGNCGAPPVRSRAFCRSLTRRAFSRYSSARLRKNSIEAIRPPLCLSMPVFEAGDHGEMSDEGSQGPRVAVLQIERPTGYRGKIEARPTAGAETGTRKRICAHQILTANASRRVAPEWCGRRPRWAGADLPPGQIMLCSRGGLAPPLTAMVKAQPLYTAISVASRMTRVAPSPQARRLQHALSAVLRSIPTGLGFWNFQCCRLLSAQEGRLRSLVCVCVCVG